MGKGRIGKRWAGIAAKWRVTKVCSCSRLMSPATARVALLGWYQVLYQVRAAAGVRLSRSDMWPMTGVPWPLLP
ncbi:hypothetical protein D3C80_1308710 [compost metagenome]